MTDIATIPKNSNEEILVSLDNFQGHDLLNMRVWFRASDGEMRPGRKGLSVNVALIPELLGALAASRDVVNGRAG